MKNFRARGNVAKVHLALGDLPTFPSLANAVGPDGFHEALSGRIHIGHEIDYLEKAFDATKYGEISAAPYLDVTIPTLLDPSLAPPGKHVLSAYFQFAPFQLKEGNWNKRRGELANSVIKTLGNYSPNLAKLVEAAHVITPLDLEETNGYSGGHIFHGELALDRDVHDEAGAGLGAVSNAGARIVPLRERNTSGKWIDGRVRGERGKGNHSRVAVSATFATGPTRTLKQTKISVYVR